MFYVNPKALITDVCTNCRLDIETHEATLRSHSKIFNIPITDLATNRSVVLP